MSEAPLVVRPREARYVEVAVQLPVAGTYHYVVPPGVPPTSLLGARVLAPFGRRGVSGVVVAETDPAPEHVARVRPLDRVLDEPPLPVELLELCQWIARYYEAPPGEVMKAALPVGSGVKAPQRVALTDSGTRVLAGEGGALPTGLRDLLAAVGEGGGSVAQTALTRRFRASDIDAAQDAGLLEVTRGGAARVRARTRRVARLCREPTAEDRAALSRAHRRRAVLEAVVAAGGSIDVPALEAEIPRATAHLRALATAGLVSVQARALRADELEGAARPLASMAPPAAPPELTPRQSDALIAVRAGLAARQFHPCLLHGITGSGKTEVYLRAIAEALEADRTAIVLVPEISLTPQLAARFCARFGDQVAVLHSGLSDRDRYDEWTRLRAGAARIALGARSAIFAPVSDLGIVVVDEEHDSSFKQEEGVRYNARDVALVRAQRAKAVCVLGSATPSLETAYAARGGRYELLVLPERATSRPLPAVELVDMCRYQPDPDSLMTAPLASAIAETLEAGDQAILFLNRRGFNTFVLCVRCGHSFRCSNCAVSLTYHRQRDSLLCHYCGHLERLPGGCPACGARDGISRRGLGTERVAEAIAARFPRARVARLDRDVASGAQAARVLDRVAARQVDVLIGTQMVTKGHDFPGVTLVGVLCADTGLSLPDFRASERTFQLLTQVAGRAGRGERPGRVLIQSYRVEASAIAAARTHDYDGFYDGELETRRELGYPPFGHLIAIRIDGADAAAVEREARRIADRARGVCERIGDQVSVLGPCEAPLARLKGRTRWHVWLRAPRRDELRQAVRAAVSLQSQPGAAALGARVVVDVDPMSAL